MKDEIELPDVSDLDGVTLERCNDWGSVCVLLDGSFDGPFAVLDWDGGHVEKPLTWWLRSTRGDEPKLLFVAGRVAERLERLNRQMTPEALRQWLTERGWTQRQLAAFLGVHESLVSRWLRGYRSPTAEQVERIRSA